MHRRAAVPVALAVLAFELQAGNAVQLTPAGQFRTIDGRPAEPATKSYTIDAAIAAQVIARAGGEVNRLVIDYEHQTMLAEENGQPAPAAGWFKSMEWREGQGLYATDVEWTERAKAMIAAGEYKYFSPVFEYDKKTGAVLRVLMGALTNKPALDGMSEIALRAAARFSTSTEDITMNPLLKAVLAALNLPETTTEADAIAGVTALKAKADTVESLNTEIAALKSKTQTVDPGKFVSIDTHNKVVTDLAALTAKLDARDLDEAIHGAISEGRLPAAEEAWARAFAKTHGIAALKESLSKRPAIAALRDLQTKGRKPAGTQDGELSEDQLAVCKSLGLDPKDYKAALAA